MKNLVWLASYPKSGNTWLRIFLAAYMSNKFRPLKLDDIFSFSKSDSTPLYYSAIARKRIASIQEEELDLLRKDVQQCLAAELTLRWHKRFIKTHNARFYPENNMPLIWPEYTRSAIYIVRNPLDIVDSMSDHNNKNHRQIVINFNNINHRIGDNVAQINQYLGTWSHHVTSWIETDDFPVLVLRYEDMLNKPSEAFESMIKFLGWKLNKKRFQRALEFTSFKNLQMLESEQGFRELSKKSQGGRFFRKGQADTWKTVLSKDLKKIVISNHGDVMARLGYNVN